MGRPVVPIRQLDRRLPELGRIKDGVKVPTGKGGERPKSIETLRFTSQDPKALAQVAAQLGGEVKAYTDPKSTDTHELVAPVAETPVILPPDPLGGTPMYEHYSGGGRERWCDGITCEQWRKGPEGPEPFEVPCPCAAAGELSCRPTVHLSVILPFTRLGGTWRWTTHSYNAAVELPGMVEAIQSLQAKGLTRGVLRVDKRTQTIAGVTRKFVVPVLGVDTTADELAAGQATLGALGAGTPVSIAPPAVAEIPERVTPDRVLMSGGGETDSLPSPAAGASSDDGAVPPAPVVDNTQSGGDAPPPSSPAAPGPTQKGGGDDDSAGKGSSPVVATAAAVGDMGSSEAESEPPPATEQQGGGGASAPPSPSGPVTVDTLETALLKAAGKSTTPAAKNAVLRQAATGHGHTGTWDDLIADETTALATLADLGGTLPDAADTPPPDMTPFKEADPKGFASANRHCRGIAARVCTEDTAKDKAQWEALVYAVSGGRTTESKELTRAEHALFKGRLESLDEGRGRLAETDDPQFLGWTIEAGEVAA